MLLFTIFKCYICGVASVAKSIRKSDYCKKQAYLMLLVRIMIFNITVNLLLLQENVLISVSAYTYMSSKQ